MFFFLLAGLWNTVLSLINFVQLFNERTAAEAAAVLPTYVAMAIACFAIFSLLLRIKTLEKNVDALWKIAEEKGYSKPNSNNTDIIDETEDIESID